MYRWSLLWMVALISGCAAPEPADGAGPTDGQEPHMTRYEWRTNTTEPVVHGVLFETLEAGTCDLSWAGVGVTPDFSDTIVMRLEEDEVPILQRIGRGQGAIPETHGSVQVLGDETHLSGDHAWGDAWAVNRTYGAGQRVNMTLAATHLDGSQAGGSASLAGDSAHLLVECSRPIQTLGEWHGADVVIFSETTFSGGASAHVHGVGETGLQAANRVEMTTEAPYGVLWLDYRGDLLLQHIAAGTITVNTPEGEHVIVDHPAALALAVAGLNSMQYEVESGPGIYSVEVTYASVDILGDIQGFLLGLAPVAP